MGVWGGLLRKGSCCGLTRSLNELCCRNLKDTEKGKTCPQYVPHLAEGPPELSSLHGNEC